MISVNVKLVSKIEYMIIGVVLARNCLDKCAVQHNRP